MLQQSPLGTKFFVLNATGDIQVTLVQKKYRLEKASITLAVT